MPPNRPVTRPVARPAARVAARRAAALVPIAFALLHAGAAHAQATRVETLLTGILDTIIYSIVGIVMTAIGFKVVDWLTPGNLAEEIAHKENRALAILAGAIMLGICIIIAGVIGS